MPSSEEGIPTKYVPLYHFLINKGREGHEYWRMTFQDIESIIKAPLPDSARTPSLFWYDLHQPRRASNAWYKAGWRTTDVNIQAETLTFHTVR